MPRQEGNCLWKRKTVLRLKSRNFLGMRHCFLTAGRPFNFPAIMCLSKVSKWPDCQSQQLATQEIYREKEKHLYSGRAMIFYFQQQLLVYVSLCLSPLPSKFEGLKSTKSRLSMGSHTQSDEERKHCACQKEITAFAPSQHPHLPMFHQRICIHYRSLAPAKLNLF